jgi:hypothetical protein
MKTGSRRPLFSITVFMWIALCGLYIASHITITIEIGMDIKRTFQI